MITVIGTKKIADSVISSILEVKNLTYSQTDTIYAFYFRSDFIITKYPNNIYAYADNKYLNQYDMRFRLPPAEGKYFISTNSLLARTDSICIKKDSTAQIINNSFAACLYTSEYEYDFQGANAYSYFSKSLLKNNVGLVYWYAEYYSASHYGSSSDSWFIRRILDYAVQP